MTTTDSYSEELRRVVTVCAGAWSGQNYDNGSTETLALLFCDRKRSLTRAEQMALMFHPDVQKLFNDFYYGVELNYESNNRWHNRRGANDTDDKPSMFYIVPGGQGLYVLQGDDDKPFFLIRDGYLFETTQQDIFDRCYLMQKWARDHEGCRCSWRGDRCVHTFHTLGAVGKKFNGAQVRFGFMDQATAFQPGDDWVQREIDTFEWDEWHELKKKHWKSTLGGHVIVPPTATDSDHLNPSTKAIRLPFHSNFTNLENVQDDFAARTKEGAETRRTINKECRVCYFGGEYGPYSGSTTKHVSKCNKWSPKYCKHGAWTEERLVEYTLERFEAALKTRSQFTLKDTWVIAQLAGIPFKLKAAQTGRKREWQICRISEEYQGQGAKAVRILVARTARDARDLTLKFVSMAELKEFLPKFMLEQLEHVSKKPIDREVLAVWAHAAIMSCGRSRNGYFSSTDGCGFTSWQSKVGVVFLATYNHVRVQLCLSRREDYIDFRSFEEMHNYVQDLTLFNITNEEDDRIPSLHHWMR